MGFYTNSIIDEVLHKFLFSWRTPTTLYHLRLKETCPKKLRGKRKYILVPQWSFINEKHYANLIFQRITYKSYIFGPCPKTVVHSGCWRLRFPWFPVVEPLWTRVLATPNLWWVSGSCSNMLMNQWIIMILKKQKHTSCSRWKQARTSRWVPGLKFHPSVPVNGDVWLGSMEHPGN